MEGTEKHLVGCKKREKIEKVTGSRDDNSYLVMDVSAEEKLASEKSHNCRDDNFVMPLAVLPSMGFTAISSQLNCHPARSAAKWRDLRFLSAMPLTASGSQLFRFIHV